MHLSFNLKNIFVLLLVISFIYLAFLIWNAKDPLPIFEIELRDVYSYLILAVEAGGLASTKIYHENAFRITKKTDKDTGQSEILSKADLVSNHLILDLMRRFPLLNIVTEEKDEILSDAKVEKYRMDKYTHWLSFRSMVEELPSKRVPINDITIWIDPLDATEEFTDLEHFTQYVTVMACVAIKDDPYFGVIYQPFLNNIVIGLMNYGIFQFDGHHKKIFSDELFYQANETSNNKKRILISRSHSGTAAELLNKVFKKDDYELKFYGGAGFKTLELVKKRADMYLHTSSIKKWDICAGDAIIRSVGGSLIDLTEGIPLNYSYGTDPLHKGGILMSVRSTYSIFSRIRKYLKP